MPHYIDLHTHFLPGLDDGASDLASSMQMLQTLSDHGFTELCATPHQRNGLFIPPADAIAAAFDLVQAEVQRAMPTLRLRHGAENYWDEILIERLRQHTVPSYGGRRAFLFELNPVALPPRLEEMLFEIRLGGTLPVMAHPERCLSVQREMGFAESLAKQTALVVDLEALAGSRSRAETKAARRLVQEGVAHAVTSDLHSPDGIREVAKGLAWIGKHLGSPGLTRLLEENPRRILSGELP